LSADKPGTDCRTGAFTLASVELSLRFGLINGVEVDVMPAQISAGERALDRHDRVVDRLQARFGLARADRDRESKS
jgi:hypothetical protein